MSDPIVFRFLCEDCEERRAYLALEYLVGPCTKDPRQPEMCTVECRRRTLDGLSRAQPEDPGAAEG